MVVTGGCGRPTGGGNEWQPPRVRQPDGGEGLVVKSEHDGRRGGPQGPWVPPDLLRKSAPPMSASRRLRRAQAAPTASAPPVSSLGVLDGEDRKRRLIMAQVISISDATDRVMAALVGGLEIEFGRVAASALAQRFLDAEECDFRWDARVEERWLGSYFGEDETHVELDRVRILGRIDGRWFVAVMLVDGEGEARGMLGKRCFAGVGRARMAFSDA